MELEKELLALHEQVQQLTSEKKKKSPPADAAPPPTADAAMEADADEGGKPTGGANPGARRAAVQAKIAHYEHFVKAMGAHGDTESDQLAVAKKQLEALRVRRWDLRPPSTVRKIATQKLERCRAQLDRYRQGASERRTKSQKLQGELDTKEASIVQKESEVVMLTAEVRARRGAAEAARRGRR